MSVAKYIENYNQKRNEHIQKNIDYANDNPYPIDELNALEEKSVFKLIFDENGKNNSHSKDLIRLAINRSRDLYDRLDRGSKGLHKLKQNEDLLKIDPTSELESRYSAMIDGIRTTNLKLTEVLDGDNFEETYDYIMDGANIQGLDADSDIVKMAFKELNGTDEDVNTLNPDDIIDDAIDSEDPLNGDTGESTETDAISEVTETAPELERESTLNPDEVIIDEAVRDTETGTESSAINLESGLPVYNENEEVETASTEVVESTPFVINDIDNITNENTNVENQNIETINSGIESVIDGDINQSGGDVISNSSELNKLTSPTGAINSTGDSLPSSTSGSGDFDDDMEATTPEELAMLRSALGMSDVDESNNIINELTESTPINSSSPTINSESTPINSSSPTINSESTTINSSSPTINSESNNIVDEAVGETEVMKEKIGIDKKIAPINTPSLNKIEDQSTSKKDDVTLTEVKTEQSVDETKSTDTPSNVTNNENNNSENNNAGYAMTDMSGVEARLRKIEMLLSGPLEVKIIE